VHTPANLVWGPTEDGQVVGEDLSCWQPEIPVLFGHTLDEARFFVRPGGTYGGAPGAVMDPAELYTPATLAKMAAVLGSHHADLITAQLTGTPYEANPPEPVYRAAPTARPGRPPPRQPQE
jgi:para-nitrobenzyl esterase